MKTILSVVVTFVVLFAQSLVEAKDSKAAPGQPPLPPVVARYDYQGHPLPVFDLVKAGVKIRSAPFYPPLLKRQGVTGSATVLIVVNTEGRVLEVGPSACTHAEFAASVVDAVKSWKYRRLLNEAGTPIMYVLRQKVIFRLGNDPSETDSEDTPGGTLRIRAEVPR